jgi:TolB protein
MRCRSLLLACCVVLWWCLSFSSAEARVYLDFSAPNFKKVVMAVPYFVDKNQTDNNSAIGRQHAGLLSRGLELHGFIDVVAPSSYGGRQDFDWPALDADYVILGKYSITGDELTLEFRLLDMLEGRMVFGRRYSGQVAKEREMILKYCDEVIKQLTGKPGISRTRIAFTSDESGFQEVYVADLLGDYIKQITRHRRLAVSPRFSPNGRLLAYTSYHSGNPNLYITDLTQSRFTRAISQRSGLNLAPAWSPDGRSMVVTMSKDGNPDLYLMDMKGKVKRRLTARAGINVSPSWSSDGRRLAFVSDRSGSPQIYVMDMKTLRTNRITFIGNDNSEPAWSPDGDWIAYSSLYEGSYHIFIIRPDGTSPTRVTRYAGDHESPSWSPDGNQLVFTRKLDNKQMLYVVFKNGTGLRQLFHVNGKLGYPQWSCRPTSSDLIMPSRNLLPPVEKTTRPIIKPKERPL